MVYVKRLIALLTMVGLIGCEMVHAESKQVSLGELETLPSLYQWQPPIVQNVDVPAHIHNGIFIPAHEEVVLIKPGNWVMPQPAPITKESYEDLFFDDSSAADITAIGRDSFHE